MLTLEDCIALSGLTQDEIDAIAMHENLPEIVAAELGCYLVHMPRGAETIRTMIGSDLAAAQERRDLPQAAKLKLVLKAFIDRCADDKPIQD